MNTNNNGYNVNPSMNDGRYMNRDNNRMNSYEFTDYNAYGHNNDNNVKQIMQEVYDRQSEGIDFHGQMADHFEYLHLPGFATWQKEMRKKEMENNGRTQKRFISRRRMMLDPPNRRYQFDATPQVWYGNSNMNLSPDEIPSHVKKGLHNCLKWEEESYQIYKEKAKELLECEAYDEYMEVKELMTHVLGEIDGLKDLISELESVRYDTKHIKKMQDRFKQEYGNNSRRIMYPMRKSYSIEMEYED